MAEASKGSISITGTSISGTTVTIAIDAQVSVARGALEERGMRHLSEQLERLAAAVKEHVGQTAQPEVVQERTAIVASELAKPRPNSSVIRTALDAITMAAGSASAIAAAVKAFQAVL
jgi:hypothetical protein